MIKPSADSRLTNCTQFNNVMYAKSNDMEGFTFPDFYISMWDV